MKVIVVSLSLKLSMSFSISPTPNYPCSRSSINSLPHKNKIQFQSIIARCESAQSSREVGNQTDADKLKLGIGSPIVIIDAPQLIKTAASVPCLRVNDGLVKPGDVGRVVSRKPKDVWAVRLGIGTYLIDGKYFKPLDIDE